MFLLPTASQPELLHLLSAFDSFMFAPLAIAVLMADTGLEWDSAVFYSVRVGAWLEKCASPIAWILWFFLSAAVMTKAAASYGGDG